MRRHLATASTNICHHRHSGACLTLPILCYFGPTDCNAAVQSRSELEMVRRVKVPTTTLFLTADGVATRLAIRELKKAKISDHAHSPAP